MGDLRIGMIGLDTSHCEAFVNVLNYEEGPHFVPGGRIVAAYPGGSDLCAVSRDRVGKFTDAMREEHGVPICDSIRELARQVDAFSLNSVDGRQHLEQFEILAESGKPVFIDKPLACSFEDARRIADLASERGVPVMSASSIRYSVGVTGLIGADEKVGSCEAFGAMPLLDDYPTYFWYGVHGADLIFSYMGRGCRTVRAVHDKRMDLLVGVWEDGRIGTVRGVRFSQYHFGCCVFTNKGTACGLATDEPPSHALMLKEVMRFFQTGVSPVDIEETVEVMAFLGAAEASLEKGGEVVELPC